MEKRFKLAYIIIGLLHLVSLFDGMESIWFRNALYVSSKLLLMPILIGLAIFYGKHLRRFWKKWRLVIVALVFSFFGDLFLLDIFKGQNFFLAGLCCFLITHIFYIRIFTKGKFGNFVWRPFPVVSLIVLVLAWAAWVFTLLLPEMGDMLAPVAVYILVISLMAISAVLRYGFVSMNSYWFVLAGAITFMFSDMFVAWRVFVTDFNHSGILIMSSYILAQYLIVEGLYRQDLAKLTEA